MAIQKLRRHRDPVKIPSWAMDLRPKLHALSTKLVRPPTHKGTAPLGDRTLPCLGSLLPKAAHPRRKSQRVKPPRLAGSSEAAAGAAAKPSDAWTAVQSAGQLAPAHQDDPFGS